MFYLMGVFPRIFTDLHMQFLECIPDSADQVMTMKSIGLLNVSSHHGYMQRLCVLETQSLEWGRIITCHNGKHPPWKWIGFKEHSSFIIQSLQIKKNNL